ncbi:hypothetical protein DFH07DRAFT_763371, partial [Mycena maculata]
RSSSPEVGDKHGRSSSADSDNMRSSQSQRTNTSGGRPRAKDLDERTKEYATTAMDLYRCYISTLVAFPDNLIDHQLLNRAWDTTCEQMGERLPLTPTVAKLITNRGPQVRGEVKTKVKPLVELLYGFKTGQNKKTIARNRKIAEDLKENSTFAFKHVKEKTGLYKHTIFQMAVNAMWFANRKDDGPRHPDLFSPSLPVEAFALVLTAVENSIDEYLTGIRMDVPFTSNDYRSVYEGHLKSLREFAEHTAKYQILDKILIRMHSDARFHSGAQPLAAATKATFSTQTLDAAIKEYEDGATTEDDSDAPEPVSPA